MTMLALKYPISLDTLAAQHSMPEGSKFLDLQVQNGIPCMWWLVPERALRAKEWIGNKVRDGVDLEEAEAAYLQEGGLEWAMPRNWKLRTFSTVPTGPPGVTENLYYVGTYQLHDGQFIGHLFSWEEIPR